MPSELTTSKSDDDDADIGAEIEVSVLPLATAQVASSRTDYLIETEQGSNSTGGGDSLEQCPRPAAATESHPGPELARTTRDESSAGLNNEGEVKEGDLTLIEKQNEEVSSNPIGKVALDNFSFTFDEPDFTDSSGTVLQNFEDQSVVAFTALSAIPILESLISLGIRATEYSSCQFEKLCRLFSKEPPVPAGMKRARWTCVSCDSSDLRNE